MSGCVGGKPPHATTFRNGSKGNATVCHGYTQAGCSVNFTYCIADAGHQWYGAEINNAQVCEWQGYEPEDCVYMESVKLYGPNTLSISVTREALSFFSAAAVNRGLLAGVEAMV